MALILSGPSVYDHATLPMTFEHMFKKNNCQAQIAELDKRKDEAVPMLRKNLLSRCRTIHPTVQWQNQFMETFACPCRNLHPLASMVVQAASALKVGILPYDGGLLDQPVIMMELIQMAQVFLQGYEEKMMKEGQAKQAPRKR